jgi:hypothetical protein
VHSLDAERPTLQLLNSCLLVGHGLHEEFGAHEAGFANLVERVDGVVERHAPNDGVGLDIDFQRPAIGPRHLAGDDRRVVGALLG